MKKDRSGSAIESLIGHAAAILQSEGHIEKEKAIQLGESIAYRFVRFEGGVAIYFPRGLEERQRLRNIEIRKKFTGNNYADLAIEFGLTDIRIRQILAKPQE